MSTDHAGVDTPANFDETFRAHYWPMVRSLAVASGDREAAEDAVQDGFIRAYARWRRISRYEDPVGWVRHVALNRLRDHFRSVKRGAAATARLATRTETVVAPPLPPSELSRVFEAIPRQQRIAAALFYVEELTVREIAESMHLSEGAVKYHLHAARRSLADALETV